MASNEQVKRYLAYWFQLGRRVIIEEGKDAILPQPIYQGDRYSAEFETCWQRIQKADPTKCHLEGTIQTIGELFNAHWEIEPCARCDMPVPILMLGNRQPTCPCGEMPLWPNTELPQPRTPLDDRTQLERIRQRITNYSQRTPQDGKIS
jgi:hypothetical protein